MFYKRESEKRRKEKIDFWNIIYLFEVFKYICWRLVLLVMNFICVIVVGRDLLIMVWLYLIVIFFLFFGVFIIVVIFFLN